MAKLINLVGQKFDKLTVIEKAPSIKRHTCWKCQCDCGNICTKTSEYLKRQGIARDCGCSLQKNIKQKEREQNQQRLVGQKFGKLLVLENTKKSNQYGYIWKCQCDCGNICEVGTWQLTSKHKQSCGCLVRESHWNDLTNKKFGLLTALYPIEDNNYSSIVWHCKCDCGNEKDVPSTYLKNGITTSCGCINYSIGEKNIEKILKNNNIDFISQYKDNTLGKKKFDFAIIKQHKIIRLIEFDGQQHYYDIKGYWNSQTPKEDLLHRQKLDKEKNQWAKQNNIPLVRIPYWERDNITLEMIMGNKYLIK